MEMESVLDTRHQRRAGRVEVSEEEMTRRSCPKCGDWHDAAIGCDPRVALDAYVTVIADSQQAAADAAETLALMRYWSRCRGW